MRPKPKPQKKIQDVLMKQENKQLRITKINNVINEQDLKLTDRQEQYLGVNQVLIYNYPNQPPSYFVPTYLRMRIKRVNQINYVQSKAEIEAEVRIWLMIKDFPEVVQNQIINQAKIQINGANIIQFDQIRQPLKLDQSQIKNRSKTAVGFMLSQTMQLDIQSNAFWSPFQLVKMFANLEIKKIVLGTGNQQYLKQLKKDQKNQLKPGDLNRYAQASVQFNFLDAHPFLQFSFGEVRQLGSFDIAQSLVDMKFSNDTIKQQEQDNEQQGDNEIQPLNMIGKLLNMKQNLQKQMIQAGKQSPDAFQHGQILIPLYKYPSTTIINVFVPLYMVAIMSLGVFFELNDMSNRDASLATFLLAYIAFLPSIRQSLPQTPKIVFTEILVYLQISTSLICFFYSLSINKQQGYTFQWDQTPTFLVCVALTLLNMTVIIGMFLIHKLIWQRRYNTLPKGSTKYISAKFLDTDDNQQWWNAQCEQQFKDFVDLGFVKPFVKKKIQKKKKKKDQSDLKQQIAVENTSSDQIFNQSLNRTQLILAQNL